MTNDSPTACSHLSVKETDDGCVCNYCGNFFKNENCNKKLTHLISKCENETDNVNHPKHYTDSKAICPGCGNGIECIDVVRHLPFNVGNAIKYLWRFESKNGIEDLKKAIWYIGDEIKRREST